MKARLLEFVGCLRDLGLRITTAETLDASRAIGVVGVEPHRFREALAATLIKDEADRHAFDDAFEAFFRTPSGDEAKRRSKRLATSEGGRAAVQSHESGLQSPRDRPPHRPALHQRRDAKRDPSASARRRMARMKVLASIPLKDLTPGEIENCDLLVKHLAQRLRRHASRRLARARYGRLDIRGTIRRSIGTGGVPVKPIRRERRPGKLDLVALCDMSYSVAVATQFFLALLGPAPVFFRRARFFGYVDTPVEVWLQGGQIVFDEPLDLHARSDLGRTLREYCERHMQVITRNTVFLLLGDARNNRRPPRADLVARLRTAARRVVWLNPEAREKWDTGDSVISAYRPHCDLVLQAATLGELYLALKNPQIGR